MLSKFKKLFRVSRNLSPSKEKEIPSDKLQESTSGKEKKGKDKGKSKREEEGDVVETQSQCPPSDEVDNIVDNEFVEQTADDVKYPDNLHFLKQL